jgi:hypothetical protein
LDYILLSAIITLCWTNVGHLLKMTKTASGI